MRLTATKCRLQSGTKNVFIRGLIMKNRSIQLLAAAILGAFCLNASAQTQQIYTVTNVVTVLVTNIITVTNIVAAPAVAEPAKVETAAIAAPVKSPWDSSISAGLTLTRGNSDTLLITAAALTEKKTKESEWAFGADGAYGDNKVTTGSGTNKTSQYVKNTDTIHVFSQYNHLFSEKFFAYLRVNALHDGIADLQYRLTIGPGVGYYLLKETNTTLAFEGGSAFVTERLGNEDNNYATLRLAERGEHKFFKQKARIWESVEILPQVNDFNNYILNAELGIESALSAKFSLQTVLVDNFNNQPAAGRQQNDIKLISGIKYKF